MIKILLILNHVQAGMGSDENANLPPAGKKTILGPGKMMEPYLKKLDAEIIATLYCGDQFFLNNKNNVTEKMVAMVKKLEPNVVICGPALHYPNFGEMVASLTESINTNTNIPAIAAMSIENPAVEKYRKQIFIVKTPKKGGIGLNESISNICNLAVKLAKHDKISDPEALGCFSMN